MIYSRHSLCIFFYPVSLFLFYSYFFGASAWINQLHYHKLYRLSLSLSPGVRLRMSAQAYTVWRVQYKLGLQDPEFTETRYHNVIFVVTNQDGSGYIHHVTGDIVNENGMDYQRKDGKKPEQSDTFYAQQYLGWVSASSYPGAFDLLLQSLPTPPRQRRFSTSTMKYERCHPDGNWYGPSEQPPPLIKCTEWTEQTAIPALLQHSLIQTTGFPKPTTTQATTSSAQTSASGSSGWIWDKDSKKYRFWDGSQWIWQS